MNIVSHRVSKFQKKSDAKSEPKSSAKDEKSKIMHSIFSSMEMAKKLYDEFANG